MNESGSQFRIPTLPSLVKSHYLATCFVLNRFDSFAMTSQSEPSRVMLCCPIISSIFSYLLYNNVYSKP